MNGLQNILILKYNNYYNKIIKRLDNKEQYLAYGFEYSKPINFNSNDGVNTFQTLTLSKEEAKSDYLVVLKEDSNEIESRWFIIESVRYNGQQYKLTLKRDVITDNFNAFVNSDSFIERGYVDYSNPLIFNKESFIVNQIKKKEILIKEDKDVPWIMIYLARTSGDGKPLSYSGEFYAHSLWASQAKYNYSFDYKFDDSGLIPFIETPTSYEIIAIPYTNSKITFNGIKVTQGDKELMLSWASSLVEKYSGVGSVYDVQLVPYCPLESTIASDGSIDFSTNNVNIIELKRGNDIAGIGFKLTEYKFTKDISTKLSGNDIILNNKKLSNQLETFRIVSPNGVGIYEYSIAKNNYYNIEKFNVDVTLKPHTPYIKVNPIYDINGLYGKDFNDYRGLICNGNFSLPMLSNEWKTFELSQKNYQTVFDRQVETQERSNEIAFTKDIINATAGGITTAVSGGIAGGLLGGPIGAAIGAGIGGAASTGGGAADVLFNKEERDLQLQLTKDVFSLNLGNVQARPISLTRSSLFDYNNKLFPYLEIYSCTDVEKEAFINYIKYRGYKLGVYGKVKDYLNKFSDLWFIQGDIVNIDISDDYHIVDEITKYFRSGFRITYGG